ncbi:hypothetical protein BRC80_00785 [Halobacteriales archaeon QH_9_66_26]|nr:MAG: hypothetical protein BRC80_00785 [Halobacteriales archaeon QH_9_66_26]
MTRDAEGVSRTTASERSERAVESFGGAVRFAGRLWTSADRGRANAGARFARSELPFASLTGTK